MNPLTTTLKFRDELEKVSSPNGIICYVDYHNPSICFDTSPSGGGITSRSTLTGGQRDLLNQLTAGLGGITDEALTPARAAPVAPLSPLQQQAFGGFGGLGDLGTAGLDIAQRGLEGFDPSIGQGFLGQAGTALQEGLQGFDPQRILSALEPGRQLALNTFNQDIVPNLLERFGATSGSSGPLNQALSEAGANLSLGLGAQAAPFLGQAALQAPGQQFQGAGLAGNLAQLPGQLAGQSVGFGNLGSNFLAQLLGVGGAQREFAQEQLTSPFLAEQRANQILAQFGPLALQTSAFQNFQKPTGPSQFSQISGLFGSTGAFGGSTSFDPSTGATSRSGGAFGPFTG